MIGMDEHKQRKMKVKKTEVKLTKTPSSEKISAVEAQHHQHESPVHPGHNHSEQDHTVHSHAHTEDSHSHAEHSPSHEKHQHHDQLHQIETHRDPSADPFLFRSNFFLGIIAILVVLLLVNQVLLPQAYASISVGGGNFGTASLGSFEYGSKITLKPMPLATGEQPKIGGYQSIVKSLPTISELSQQPSTGDAVQDLLNNIVPTGTPWYGEQAGVSFDDPIAAQKHWGSYRALPLDATQTERWNRIVNSFTCDYCCGSPQHPTIITHCGCAHAAAAQGMAKWFIQNYADQYSDEEIYGEMARWYALWYPKGTIERIIQESQV